MPKPRKPACVDNADLPQEVFQAQRIKVLEAQLAEAKRTIAQLRSKLAALNPTAPTPRTTDSATSGSGKSNGRRSMLTQQVLAEVWALAQQGTPVAELAARFRTSQPIIKAFLNGYYWTRCAREVYAQLGVVRRSRQDQEI